jgi:hypothetical protein
MSDVKVLSQVTLSSGRPVDVRVVDSPPAPKPVKPPDPRLACLQLPNGGGNQTFQLTPGTRYVSIYSNGSVFIAFGDGGVVANSTDSHFLFKTQRLEFDVSMIDTPFIAVFDAGDTVFVSCFA